jgi:hypothetical protein
VVGVVGKPRQKIKKKGKKRRRRRRKKKGKNGNNKTDGGRLAASDSFVDRPVAHQLSAPAQGAT